LRPIEALARPTDPPGLRRLRFPFFKPLVKEHRGFDHDCGPACAGPVVEKTKCAAWSSQSTLVSNPEIAAHCRAPEHGARKPYLTFAQVAVNGHRKYFALLRAKFEQRRRKMAGIVTKN
jgi:hypothetical protein